MAILIGILYILGAVYAGLPNLDSDNEVLIKTSSSIFVEISSNPTTGYSWFFLEPRVNSISVKNLAGVYNPPPPGSSVGESGKQVFELVCNESCSLGEIFILSLVKKRPWEDISVEARAIRVRVSNE